MIASPSIDLSLLPETSLDVREPLWWGQMVMAAIEGTLFVILLVCYLYYRSKFQVWPPPGVSQPLGLATFNTVLLLASCIPVYLADKAVQENQSRKVLLWELVVVVMAAAFLVLRVMECKALDFKWNSHEYGSIVWAMLWLHSFDFGAALLEEIVLVAIFAAGLVGKKQRLGIRVSTILYYFLVAIWIPQYCLIYLYPLLLAR